MSRIAYAKWRKVTQGYRISSYCMILLAFLGFIRICYTICVFYIGGLRPGEKSPLILFAINNSTKNKRRYSVIIKKNKEITEKKDLPEECVVAITQRNLSTIRRDIRTTQRNIQISQRNNFTTQRVILIYNELICQSVLFPQKGQRILNFALTF
jgi:hypothetical protein